MKGWLIVNGPVAVWLVLDGAVQTVGVFSSEAKARSYAAENSDYPGQLAVAEMYVDALIGEPVA